MTEKNGDYDFSYRFSEKQPGWQSLYLLKCSPSAKESSTLSLHCQALSSCVATFG